MAIKLPVHERQVRSAPLQAPSAQVVNASIAPGINAVGQGIERLGAGIGSYEARQEHERQRQAAKADALRVDVVSQQISEAKRQLLEDPATGFLTTKFGQAAITDSDSVKDYFEKHAKHLAKDLSPSQRAALEPITLHESSSLGHAVDQHVSKQSDLLEQQTSQAIFTGRANDASSAALRGDMDAAEEAIGAGLGHIDELAQRNGWTQPIRDVKEREFTASARQGVIETLLGGNQPGMAAQLLHEWGGSLNQDKVNDSKLRERIEGAVVKSQAEEIATGAWGMSKRNAADAELAVSKDETLDPRVRDLAIGLVRKRSDEFNEAQKRADGEVLARIGETVARGRGKFTIDELSSNPDFLELRTQAARTNALRMVNAEKLHKTGGGGNTEGKEALQNYLTLVATDADAALDVQVASRYAGVPKFWRDKILEQQGKLGTAEGKKEAVALGEFNDWVKGKLGQVSKQYRGAAQGEMLDAYERYKKDNGGKPMPRADAEKIIADMFADGMEEHFFGNKRRTRIESQLRGETWIPPKDAPAPTAAQPAPPKSDIVWMREPPRADGKPQRMLQVKPAEVEKYQKLGATVVQR